MLDTAGAESKEDAVIGLNADDTEPEAAAAVSSKLKKAAQLSASAVDSGDEAAPAGDKRARWTESGRRLIMLLVSCR